MHYKVTVRSINEDGVNFHKIFKIFVAINQKPCGIWGYKFVWMIRYIGTKNIPSFVKIGDPKFLVDLTWNDPYVRIGKYQIAAVVVTVTSCHMQERD